MELRQLRYFVAVAEERHFGRAAARVHIATPSLSQQIRVLEQDLRSQLFERTRYGVQLTAAGEALLEHARVLLAQAERAREEIRRTEVARPGQVGLRLATGAQYVVGPVLLDLGERAPALQVDTATGFDADVLDAVRDGRADAGVVWVGSDDHGLAQVVLREVPLQLAVPTGHPLTGLEQVAVEDLAGEALVLFSRHLAPGAWDWLARHLLPASTPWPQETVVRSHPITTGAETMLEAVAAGRGVTPTVPAAANGRGGVVLRPLTPPLHVPLMLVWREPATPGVQQLAALLTDPAGQPAPTAAGGPGPTGRGTPARRYR